MKDWVRKPLTIAVMLSVCVFPRASHAGWFGPSNYDECVLDKIKEAANTAAVIAVHRSCAKLFPPKIVSLPVAAQSKVFVLSAVFAARFAEVIIRNANPDWTVHSLEVLLFQIPGKPGTVRIFAANEAPAEGTVGTGYEVTDSIPEATDLSVSFELDPSMAYGIMIMKKGIKGHR